MKALAARFRHEVEERHLACWNLSDYAVLCWLSAGGNLAELVRLWQRPAHELGSSERLLIDVLKEKTGVVLPGQAATFVATARHAAAGQTAAVTG